MTLLTLARPNKPARAKALVFEDTKSRELLQRIKQLALSRTTVLLCGETGTGKEIVARTLHDSGPRATEPFVAVNCGALTEGLVESELFGHERGAFTGADSAKAGWFEAAKGGTLFLDEVTELSPSAQVKLLRVLQEAEVVRLGSRVPIRTDVRLIAASNVPLEHAVATRRFRADLYYRLNVASLTLPPLRERPGDIPPLAVHFTEIYRERMGLPSATLSSTAIDALLAHDWPGNIRELENVIQHALHSALDGHITPHDLRVTKLDLLAPVSDGPDPLEGVLTELFEQGQPNLWQSIEESVIRAAFRYCDRNQLQAARLLGISRNIVRARLIQCGEISGSIRPPPPDDQSVANDIA